jgi:sugar phosphate isomerase/epimerase
MYKNLNAQALGASGHQSEIIELALTYGFQGMDIDVVEIFTRAKLHGMPYARRLIDSAQIRIGTFKLPLEWDIDDDLFKSELETLKEYAQVAADLGCTRCVATIAPAGDKRPYHENFEFHRHRLADISKVLAPFNIWLGVGFRASEELRKAQAFQFIHDLDALSLLVNMVGTENVGMVLDVWDLHVSGATAESIRALSAPQIVAVQLADLPEDASPTTELTEASRVLWTAEGGIDLGAYMVALAEVGYEGPVTCRPSRGTMRGTRRDPVVRQAGEALNQIWRAAGLTADGKLPVPAETTE